VKELMSGGNFAGIRYSLWPRAGRLCLDSAVITGSDIFARSLAVRCLVLSPMFCEAIGFADHPFADEWDGRNWVAQHFPVGIAKPSELSNVSCVSPHFCVAAVSSDQGVDYDHSAVDVWDGRSWATGPSRWSAPSLHTCPACRRRGAKASA